MEKMPGKESPLELLNKEVRDVTKNKLDEEMTETVKIAFFTQEQSLLIVPNRVPGQECMYCRETRKLLEEVSALTDKIELETFDFVAAKDKAAEYGVDKIPAAVIVGQAGPGPKFYGIPSGYEYTSLIEALIDVSKGSTGLGEKTKAALKSLDKDIHIQVFVTPTCPYCSIAVRIAHQMALESPRIRAEMVEATEFPHLAQKYNVYGVPKTVINETISFEGAVPEEVFLGHVLKAAGQVKT
jgi:glutaredoxin-like protein